MSANENNGITKTPFDERRLMETNVKTQRRRQHSPTNNNSTTTTTTEEHVANPIDVISKTTGTTETGRISSACITTLVRIYKHRLAQRRETFQNDEGSRQNKQKNQPTNPTSLVGRRPLLLAPLLDQWAALPK